MLFYILGTTMATIAALIVILFVCIIIDRRRGCNMKHSYSYKTCDRCGKKITGKWYEYKKPCVISYEYADKEEGYIEEKRLIDVHVKKAKKDIKKIRKLESFNISFYNSREHVSADLCGKCMKQFKKFMRNDV